MERRNSITITVQIKKKGERGEFFILASSVFIIISIDGEKIMTTLNKY